jgi:tryptophanyl-tRNA synthetase
LTYPVLMAADILLYETEEVPVGDDQRQHLELTRDVAEKFNHRFGETFRVPVGTQPKVAARVMDLQEPTRKMSKSVSSPLGKLNMFDSPGEIERKIAKAVTDNDDEVRFDWSTKPGVSNLLEIFASLNGETPEQVAGHYTRYGELKNDLAALVIEVLAPMKGRRRGGRDVSTGRRGHGPGLEPAQPPVLKVRQEIRADVQEAEIDDDEDEKER